MARETESNKVPAHDESSGLRRSARQQAKKRIQHGDISRENETTKEVVSSVTNIKKKRTASSSVPTAVAEVLSKSLAPLSTPAPSPPPINPLYHLLHHSTRGVDRDLIVRKFSTLWDQSPKTAIQALHFLRDCRGKTGEHQVFYHLCTWLRQYHPQTYIMNLMSMIGYFKDLLHLAVFAEQGNLPKLGDKEYLELEVFAAQLKTDSENTEISLAAKWAPSEKLAFDKKHRLATRIAKLLFKKDVHAKYRKLLSQLRARLDIVEVKMCAGRWSEINYDEVPAAAHSIYGKSFSSHDKERYLASRAEHILSAKRAEDILKPYFDGACIREDVETAWAELVKKVKEEVGELSVVPVIDSDFDMRGLYKRSAISLALLCCHLSPKGTILTKSGMHVNQLGRDTVFTQVQRMIDLPGFDSDDLDQMFGDGHISCDELRVIFFTCKPRQLLSKRHLVTWNVANDSTIVTTDLNGNILLSGYGHVLLRFCMHTVTIDSLVGRYHGIVHDNDEQVAIRTQARNS